MKQIYKDKDVNKTIDLLLDFFYKLNLEIEEKKSNTGTITNSHTILAKNIGFFSNGKGSDIKYSRASGLAELYERIRNLSFVRFGNYSEEIFKNQEIFGKLNLNDLKNSINKFLEFENIYCDEKYNKILLDLIFNNLSLYNLKNNYFFGEENIKEHKDSYCIKLTNNIFEELYLPLEISDLFLGTNGMSAGNSYEEAFVQAYSEIVERDAIKLVNNNKIMPDLVEENSLRKYTKVFNYIKKISKIGDFEIKIYTFEREFKFPVVCTLILDKNRVRYSFKFGAHSSEEYAIERCFTELLQGTELLDEINWKDVNETFKCNNGESFKIFLNGKGLLSRNAFINFIYCIKSYKTKCLFKDNIEAYDYINSIEKNIFVKKYSKYPIVSLQLYIPSKSLINELNLKNIQEHNSVIKEKENLMTILIKLRRNEKITDEEKVFLEKLGLNVNISRIISTNCPIQNQFLSKIKIFDLLLSIYVKEQDILNISKLYTEFNYNTGKTLYKYYDILYYSIMNGIRIPNKVIELFKENYYIKDNINDLSYCNKCKYYLNDNCIRIKKLNLIKDLSEKLYECK